MVHEDASLLLKPVTDIAPSLNQSGLSALTSASGLTEVVIRNESRLAYTAPIAGTDWTLVIALNRNEALAGVTTMMWSSLLGSLLIALVVVVLIAALLSKVLGRLTALRNALHEIGSGEGDLTQPHRLDRL